MRSGVASRLWARRWAAGLFAAMAAGAVFRLIWLRDVEFKLDEAWALQQVQEFWRSHALPLVGVESSAGLSHPGLNLWVLLAISAVLPTVGPLELTRAVQVINVAAIILLALFARYVVSRPEREPWLWSVALVSVNPLAVLFSRKLWAQELFPIFTLALLLGWWHRGRWWGAFLWGLVGALLGQVHLTGFLFALPFVIVSFWLERRSVRWSGWLAGSALGAIPLLPWLFAVVGGAHGGEPLALQNPLVPLGNWVNYTLGIDLFKSLGDDFTTFLAFPRIGGIPSCAGAVVVVLIVAIFAIILIRIVEARRRGDGARLDLWALARGSPTGRILLAGCLGFCVLLALMGRPAYQHYLIVAFSLPVLSLAWLAFAGAADAPRRLASARRCLAAMVIAQASLTILFLCFVHEAKVIHGDYGTTYGARFPAN